MSISKDFHLIVEEATCGFEFLLKNTQFQKKNYSNQCLWSKYIVDVKSSLLEFFLYYNYEFILGIIEHINFDGFPRFML